MFNVYCEMYVCIYIIDYTYIADIYVCAYIYASGLSHSFHSVKLQTNHAWIFLQIADKSWIKIFRLFSFLSISNCILFSEDFRFRGELYSPAMAIGRSEYLNLSSSIIHNRKSEILDIFLQYTAVKSIV